MFKDPKYLQNTFSIIFSRQESIRRYAFQFEDILNSLYIQPQVMAFPDDIHPEMPRMLFTSKPTLENNFRSKIVISQVSFILDVIYPDTSDFSKSSSKNYLLNEVLRLFELLGIIQEDCPCFCGFTTLVQIPVKEEYKEQVITQIYNSFSLDKNYTSNIYELQLKTSSVIREEFFSNITVENYRRWDIELSQSLAGTVPKLSQSKNTESGIQIMVDCNDRYAFNENQSYCCTQDKAREIIELGFAEVNNIVQRIRGN